MDKFVENLVNMMSGKELALQDKYFNTALSLAAAAGNLKTASLLMAKNQDLFDGPSYKLETIPLFKAALFAKPEMVRSLYHDYTERAQDWTRQDLGWFVKKCIEADVFDVAVKLVNDHWPSTMNNMFLSDILILLAQNSHGFRGTKPHIISRIIKSNRVENGALELLRNIWKKVTVMPKSEIQLILRGRPLKVGSIETYPSRILFVAAKRGNTSFIRELIDSYPDLIWKVDDKGRTIFHIAIKRRHTGVFNLLYDQVGSRKEPIIRNLDMNGNNMLHLVGKSAKPKRFQNVSGVALQMQHELLWFKEVEKMMPPTYREMKNKDGEIPHDLFTKTHREIVTQGQKWMKDTSAQCMVVGTLISTIVFAAAFTLPGGYNQDIGIPFFRHEPSLIIFVISDAISLISSSTSVLIFLSILTSRFAERDFLELLPKKLMFGLATLFLSIVTMMMAFSASFFLLYNQKLKWVPIIITSLAAMPVILYAILQFRLLGDVFYSTFQSRYLFKPKRRTFRFWTT